MAADVAGSNPVSHPSKKHLVIRGVFCYDINMSKAKIIILIVALLYLCAGVAYSKRGSYCEEQRLLANPELNSGVKENEGSNMLGRSINSLFWPFFIVSDKINHAGVFACTR